MSVSEGQHDDCLDEALTSVLDLDVEEMESFIASCSPEERLRLADFRFLDALLTFTCNESSEALNQRVQRVVLAVSDISVGQPAVSPPLGFLGSAYHGTVGFFSQDVPFAILVATLFMALGGLIGSWVTVEHYTQMPGQSQPYASDSFASNASADKTIQSEEEVKWVGRITGMVDCKWSADEGFYPPSSYDVSLGRKYKLDSGLMEITYYTGAKVILQGPCTYEVDSAAGGYLSLGKLTARVEKKGERGEGRGESEKAKGGGRRAEEAVASGQRSVASEANLPSPSGRGAGGEGGAESADQSALTLALSQRERGPDNPPSALRLPPSPSPQPPAPSPSALFAVRTPTAVVTDLGTEFGVEVNDRGFTDAHVFRGKVTLVAMTAEGNRLGHEMVLGENESAGVERPADGGNPIVVRRSGGENSEQFVRVEQLPKYVAELRLKPFRRWQAFSRELRKHKDLVAYYDFQQKPGKPSVLPNVAENGDSALDGVVETASWTNGRMTGKQALFFDNPDSHVQVNIPGTFQSLTLTAWVNASWWTGKYRVILASGKWEHPGQIGWELLTERKCNVNIHPPLGDPRPEIPYDSSDLFGPDGYNRWHHLAVVHDSKSRVVVFYADGREISRCPIVDLMPLVIGRARIGNIEGYPQNAFPGRIDELAIFRRALTAEEIQQLFKSAEEPGT